MKQTLCIIIAIIAVMLTTTPALAEDTHTHNPYRQVIDNMTEQERLEMEQVLYWEASTDTFEGRVCTAQVMLNRVLSKDKGFPDDMHSVLSQRHQYSTWHKRNRATPGEPESDAITYIYLAEGMDDLPLDINRLFQDCKPIGKNPIKVGRQYFGY